MILFFEVTGWCWILFLQQCNIQLKMLVIQNLSSSWSLLYLSVDHQKPVVCSSCLNNDGKASLSQVLLALGGKLVNTWNQDCTHLAMPSVKVTIKVRTRLCIFISACYVFCPCVCSWLCADVLSVFLIRRFLLCCAVVPSWSQSSSQSSAKPCSKSYPLLKLKGIIPSISMNTHLLHWTKPDLICTVNFLSFIPDIDEPSLTKEDVNLGVIPIRKQLFTKKTFIFLSAKQVCLFLSFWWPNFAAIL